MVLVKIQLSPMFDFVVSGPYYRINHMTFYLHLHMFFI